MSRLEKICRFGREPFIWIPLNEATRSTPSPLALAKAVARDDRVEVKRLLDAGVDPNASPGDHHGPIVFRAKSPRIVRLLAKAGADLEALDGQTTPLVRAIYEGAESVASALLEAGAAPTREALMAATDEQLIRIVERLVDHGADLDGEPVTETPLHLAAKNGASSTCETLLRLGADPDPINGSGHTPLTCAIHHRWYDCVETLLDNGADPDGPAESHTRPIFARAIDQKLFVTLIEKGADTDVRNTWGETPLHVAVRCGWHDAVDELLRRGHPVDAVDSKGQTPLRYAVDGRSFGIVGALLDAGADPTRSDDSGVTPVDAARGWSGTWKHEYDNLIAAAKRKMTSQTLPRESLFSEDASHRPSGWAQQRVAAEIERAASSDPPKIVVIDYCGADGVRKLKAVEPYSYRKRSRKKYFYGWDLEEGGIRSFRTAKIASAKTTTQSFTPRFDVEIGDGHAASRRPRRIVRARPVVAKKLKHEHQPSGFAKRKAREMLGELGDKK